ncbi:MAG: hypothetical protein L3J32_11375, partial [Rhizobiaceae bacterium]|nr:hypothetical protein [Rhizobiaceae bacterium]
GRKLISQTWRLYYDELPPNNVLIIPLTPILVLEALRYYDQQGDAQVLPSEDYEFDLYSSPARLWIKTAVVLGQKLNGFEIDLQVGFGATGIDVPGDIIRAILLTVSHWYEFRGAIRPADQPLSNPSGLNKLLAPYIKVKL